MRVVEKPTIKCEHCDLHLKQTSLHRHQRTTGCRLAARHKALLRDGWSVDIYPDRHAVKRSMWLSNITGIHAMEAVTGYNQGGWGHASNTYSRKYIRESIMQMYSSPQVTDEEFNMCLELPESDEKFQAIWTLVRLTCQN